MRAAILQLPGYDYSISITYDQGTQPRMKFWIVIALTALFSLAACGKTTSEPEPSPSATRVAVEAATPTATLIPPSPSESETIAGTAESALEPTPQPTATPEVTPEPAVDWLSVSGRTEEGLATLGNPDAPVTLIDYSDFL